jgi:hypothetical protein
MASMAKIYMWSLLAGGAALNLIGEAAAQDYKVYPGTFCVETADTTPQLTYNRLRSTNEDTISNTWACPAVRDLESGEVVGWTVTVNRDGNTTDDWVVQIHICEIEGSTCDGDFVEVPKVNGVQTLAGFWDTVSNYETFGPMTLSSLVPPGCRIYNYAIGEN